MKYRLLFIICFLVIGLIVIFNIPISKSKNWTTSLVNGYVIEKKSETNIKIGKYDKEFVPVLDDYVAEYNYGKNYILLKCLDDTNGLVVKFYIIDSKIDKVYGPYYDYQDFIDNQNNIMDEEIDNNYIKTFDKE